MKKIKHPTLFYVMHEQFATDHYQYCTTIVEAVSKQEAMNKLNDWLKTKPDGVYTALPCKSVKHVFRLTYYK